VGGAPLGWPDLREMALPRLPTHRATTALLLQIHRKQGEEERLPLVSVAAGQDHGPSGDDGALRVVDLERLGGLPAAMAVGAQNPVMATEL
jgi:hypothetical protein